MTRSKMKNVQTPEVAGAETAQEKGLATIPDEAFTRMDERDEAQIVAQLKGEYIEEYVYSFEQGGRTVVGLSWLGIQEASRAYGGITTEIVEKEEADDEIIYTVRATDKQTASSRLGVAAQSKRMGFKSGQSQRDPFCRPKALAKAQRNAIRALLPQQLLKAWIEDHLEKAKKGNQKTGGGGGSNEWTGKLPHADLKILFATQEKNNITDDEFRAVMKALLGVDSTKKIESIEDRDHLLLKLAEWAGIRDKGLSIETYIETYITEAAKK